METLVVTLAVMLAGAPAVQGAEVSIGPATQVAEIDTGKVKGDPIKLAWSPDGAQLYLQTAEVKSNGSRTERHFVLPLDGKSKLDDVEGMPEWAGKYWAWKSAQAAPGSPGFKIELSDETKTVRATAAPMGGDLARGGSGGTDGTTLADATAAAQQSQQVRVITLKLRGQTIGEFMNGPLVPGLTFGWAPPSLGLVAYTNKDGKVMVMDESGKTKEVGGTSAAMLPAWSEDGAKLAFLKKDGRKKYTLHVAGVSR